MRRFFCFLLISLFLISFTLSLPEPPQVPSNGSSSSSSSSASSSSGGGSSVSSNSYSADNGYFKTNNSSSISQKGFSGIANKLLFIDGSFSWARFSVILIFLAILGGFIFYIFKRKTFYTSGVPLNSMANKNREVNLNGKK